MVYAHVKVNPAADICRSFAQLGFCETGADCSERHVFECPDYAKTSNCANKKCSLPHIDRAGSKQNSSSSQIAKFSPSKEPSIIPNDSSSDISSDDEDYEEIDSEDIDSDDLDEEIMVKAESVDGRNASYQQDYIQLSGYN
ncbi:MAG: hypothetical protein M1829_002456 [Trizodia sp. TS-e1964]|nr:MAG: hypothetical protein M1829_002456 [Trizodia sp. TS-e1964]